MALDQKSLFNLAKTLLLADKTKPVAYSFGKDNFSYHEVEEALRAQFKELAGTVQARRENKNKIFTLMEQSVDEILPQKVLQKYGELAEIKQFNQGEMPIFTQRITESSRRRAKQFITKVGLAGVYEVFKLDGSSFQVPTSAYGGAAQVSIEEYLDGRVDYADLLNIVMEGIDEAIYIEIERALQSFVTNLPVANKTTQNAFVETEMDKLLTVSDSYGGKSSIFCTFEFASSMLPASTWASDEMKKQLWDNGYLTSYKGHNVVIMPQSFEDNTNSKKVIDPRLAYILPTGRRKPVKIAFEGPTMVKENENYDWSIDTHIYKKLGVAATTENSDICVYVNTSLV